MVIISHSQDRQTNGLGIKSVLKVTPDYIEIKCFGPKVGCLNSGPVLKLSVLNLGTLLYQTQKQIPKILKTLDIEISQGITSHLQYTL